MPDYLFRVDIRFSALDDVEARRMIVNFSRLWTKENKKQVKLQRLELGKSPKSVPLTGESRNGQTR